MPAISTVRFLMIGMSLVVAGLVAGLWLAHRTRDALSVHPVAGIESRAISPEQRDRNVDWFSYDCAIVDPVVVPHASDTHFVGLSEADLTELARYAQKRVSGTLSTRYAPAASLCERKTLRIKLTILGAESGAPANPSLAWIFYIRGLFGAVHSSLTGGTSHAGSITYRVEIYDASSNRLLDTLSSHQFPSALNYSVRQSPLGAAKAGIDRGAASLLARIR
jgi:hypothetical protein